MKKYTIKDVKNLSSLSKKDIEVAKRMIKKLMALPVLIMSITTFQIFLVIINRINKINNINYSWNSAQ